MHALALLVRWSSAESLRIYARMNMDYQAKRRDMLQTADVNSVNATRRPTIDETPEEIGQVEALADALEND